MTFICVLTLSDEYYKISLVIFESILNLKHIKSYLQIHFKPKNISGSNSLLTGTYWKFYLPNYWLRAFLNFWKYVSNIWGL
jgi:hypothetical protein